MFNRIFTSIIAVFLCAFFVLLFFWQEPLGMALYSDSPVTHAHRLSQDLGGKWNSYTSLRQAWIREASHFMQEEAKEESSLIQAKSVIIPSDQSFHVAAKRFQVTGKWGFKTAQFVLEGVYGKTRIFLNGIEEANYLGEFEGVGGLYTINVPPSRFNFDHENVLYLELSPAQLQKNQLFGWLSPERGKVTGQVRLEAVSETTIDFAKTAISYRELDRKVMIDISLKHHTTLDYGPWVIYGVLKDQEQKKVAECLLPMDTNGEFQQQITLPFELSQPQFWHPEQPYLYELDLVLTNNLGDYDSMQIPIGIRKGAVTFQKWMIGDQAFQVKGEILTAEQAFSLQNQRQAEDYLTNLKSRGLNTVYFMGFFPDEGWLYQADRLGIAVWLEMPVNMMSKDKIPSPDTLTELILTAKRHPSVMAWSGAKGSELSEQQQHYFQELRKLHKDIPVYRVNVIGETQRFSMEEEGAVLNLESDGLSGQWGKLSYADIDQSKGISLAGEEPVTAQGWKEEKAAAIVWLCWLIIFSIQKLRYHKWQYTELMKLQPKRTVRMAAFWSCLGLVSRRVTLGGIITGLIFKLPLSPLPWLSYDFGLLIALRNQSPWLIWLLISIAFIILRVFQVGLAAPSFPQTPGAFALSCWLERRGNWLLFVGIAWVMTFYGFVWYLPLAVYGFFYLIFCPMQIRDVWKTGGKYLILMVVPMTLLIVAIATVVYHRSDFSYVGKMVLPEIQRVLSMGVSD